MDLKIIIPKIRKVYKIERHNKTFYVKYYIDDFTHTSFINIETDIENIREILKSNYFYSNDVFYKIEKYSIDINNNSYIIVTYPQEIDIGNYEQLKAECDAMNKKENIITKLFNLKNKNRRV